MARFPSKPKQGSVGGRRRFFSSEGSADAGAPGTKKELRQAKHRVAGNPQQRVKCVSCGRTFNVTHGMKSAVSHRDRTGHSNWEAVR